MLGQRFDVVTSTTVRRDSVPRILAWQAEPVDLAALEELPLTYSEVGATAAGRAARGIRPPRTSSARSARAEQRFEQAADAVMHWGMQRGPGLRVQASSEVAAVDTVVVVRDGFSARAVPGGVRHRRTRHPRIRLRHAAGPSGVRRGTLRRAPRPGHLRGVRARCRRSPGPRPGGARPAGRWSRWPSASSPSATCARCDR